VNTISNQVVDGRRRRRTHSAEFKADAVTACMQPGMSMAAVALSRGVNANLLRRWVQAAELSAKPACEAKAARVARTLAPPAPFVALRLPADAVAQRDIRIELRRGATAVSVTWPTEAAARCVAWMGELLR
jgi:transposase